MLPVDTDTHRVQQVTGPTASLGFWAAFVVNTIVAVVFWIAVSHKHGYDWVGDYYEDWLRPTTVFLAIAVVSGLVALAVSRWRRFGRGLITGAVTVALVDLAWTLLYFVSEGS